ncbi:hypothetical protein [Isoptericola cucumis]|uniref:Uncharacterized protein n=1 Tax=Isoptericola cucumis TaxID=1776856 RepID=A0ABQ2B5H8_9MICO|nr:hypothetical protein [Isoptericola cucumis]GGI06984.1 hypothetical protein GCM10007368_13890 [Isoptericola cucumis]
MLFLDKVIGFVMEYDIYNPFHCKCDDIISFVQKIDEGFVVIYLNTVEARNYKETPLLHWPISAVAGPRCTRCPHSSTPVVEARCGRNEAVWPSRSEAWADGVSVAVV